VQYIRPPSQVCFVRLVVSYSKRGPRPSGSSLPKQYQLIWLSILPCPVPTTSIRWNCRRYLCLSVIVAVILTTPKRSFSGLSQQGLCNKGLRCQYRKEDLHDLRIQLDLQWSATKWYVTFIYLSYQIWMESCYVDFAYLPPLQLS
jgi:hypothetical protein